MPESQEVLERPRLVVPNTADRWFTLANYDLFLFDGRLVALKGLTMRGAMRDPVKEAVTEARKRRKDRRNGDAVGEQSRENAWQRARTRTEKRVAATHASAASLNSSESSDRIVIQLADVSSAKLSKRGGIVVLRLQLKDGTQRSWRWMNSSQARVYAEAAPVLRDVLGSLLRQ